MTRSTDLQILLAIGLPPLRFGISERSQFPETIIANLLADAIRI